MVVFTCNHCGESLQKPRVEKHYQTVCRTFKNLTCVDCFKDFRGQEYEVHTKCYTEEQRYSAKGSLPDVLVKKGEAKQESWTEMINSLIAETKDIHVGYRNLLLSISGCANVPRKKQKFINYILNTNKRVHLNIIEGAWDLLEKYKEKHMKPPQVNKDEKNEENVKRKAEDQGENNKVKIAKTEEDSSLVNGNEEEMIPKKHKKKKSKNAAEAHKENNINGVNEENGIVETKDDIVNESEPKKKSKKKKMKSEDVIEEETAMEIDSGTKFSYEDKIREILSAKQKISLKKLQKKVITAYLKHSGLDEATEKTIKKFQKKLKKIDGITINDDQISFKQ